VDSPAKEKGATAGKELLDLADQLLSGLQGLRQQVERVSARLDAEAAKRRANRALAQVSGCES
jgi:hypothetical protein